MIKSLFSLLIISFSINSFADEIGCVTTGWRVFNDDKICVTAIKDPDISGVACHISYAKTGGVSGAVGLAEDKSNYSVSCQQNNQIVFTKPIPSQTEIFQKRMNLFFKGMKVVRMYDKNNNSLVYLVFSEKLIDGSPYNSVSTVPLNSWGTLKPQIK